MSIAEKLMTIAENQEKVFDAGKESVINELKEAQKGTASGEIIGITDISPIEHNLGVKLSSKNLIPYPYADTTKTLSGITFTDNGDGSITLNGTANITSSFFFTKEVYRTDEIGYLFEDGETYFISLDKKISGINVVLVSYTYDDVVNYFYAGKSFTVDKSKYKYSFIRLQVNGGTTLENVTVKPMIEKGTKATSYTPYVDVSTTTLNALGKNIYNPTVRITPKTVRGLTIQYLEDEDCYLLNGTTEITNNYYQINENILVDDYISIAVSVVGGSVNNPNNKYVRFYVGSKDTENGTTSNWKDINLVDGIGKSTISKKYIGASWFFIGDGVTFDNFKVRISVEKGVNANKYEPYIEPTSYTPNADGTVEGVKSIYPTTTLYTDTSGVLIECEYIKDLNAVVGELTDAILSIGGMLNV